MAILAPRLLTSTVCVASLKIRSCSSIPLIVTGMVTATRVLSRLKTHVLFRTSLGRSARVPRTLDSRLSTKGKWALRVVLWENGWLTPPPCCGEVFEEPFQDLSDKFNVSMPLNQEQTIFSRNFFFSFQGTWSDLAHRLLAGSCQCKCCHAGSSCF